MSKELINKTRLSPDQAKKRGFLHRDYLAHCLRYTHIVRWLTRLAKGDDVLRVLDVGCGNEAPLAKLIYTSKLGRNVRYLGLDAGGIDPDITFNAWRPQLKAKVLFPEVLEDSEALFDVIVMLEVLEHVEHPRQNMMIRAAAAKLADSANSLMFISTPCYDPHVGAAGNHVNELTYQALGFMLEDAGLAVEGVYGTFASQRDYREQAVIDGYAPLMEKLSEYYDSTVVAVFFAPLYPQLARNCIWRLKLSDKTYRRRFTTPGELPHGSATENIS